MPANEYIQSMVNRTARPRSARLRALGGVAPSSVSQVGGNYLGEGHSHANLADLNRLSVNDGYIFLTDETVDPDTGDVLRDLTKASAGYADRALSNADGHELNWFIPMEVGGELTLKLNPIYKVLWAEGCLADGGVGSAGGGGGGSSTLYGLNDVNIPHSGSFPGNNDLLTYNLATNKWVNTAKSTFLSDYYTKAQVDQLLSAINQFDYVTAQTLPTAGIGTMYKIYLVPSANPETRNVKDEFITLFDGTNYSWERIGSTEIDLTGYVTTQGLNTALANYALTSSLAAVATSGNYDDLSNKPATLPNPQALAFGNDSYDGSAAKTITAASLGAVTSVSLSAGSANGTLKLTVNGAAGNNVSVPGLGSLAYKSSLLASDIPDLSGTYLKFVGWLGSADNLNNCTFGSWVYASSPANYPGSAGGGQLVAFGTPSSPTEYGQAQMAINTTGIPFFRMVWGSSWTPWREALVDGVTQSISGAKTFSDNMTLGGNLSMANNKHIDLGPIRLEYYNTGSANALRVTANDGSTVNVVVDGWISDGGIGSGSGSGGGSSTLGGLNDVTLSSLANADMLTYDYSAGQWVNTRKSTFLSGYLTSSALDGYVNDISTGSGNYISGVSKSGKTLTFTYGTLPTTIALSNVTGADDLKAIEALTGTTGLLKKTAANTWTLDTNTYLKGNQTITLSGDVSGSGTTAITVSIGTGKVTNAMLAGSIENGKLNTIGVTKGGTGLTSISKGSLLYAPGLNTIAELSANGTNTKKYLTQTSNNAPVWGTIAFGDLPTMYAAGATVGDSRARASLITVEAISYNLSSGSSDKSRIYWDAGNEGWHLQGNLIIDGWIGDGGIGSGSGGGGGSSTLAGLNDVTLTSPAQNDVLVYGSQNSWINVSKSTFLSGYATQNWVGQQGYLTSASLNGYATQTWVGQQGFITGGYIGKTALQASSANQDLTGIKQVVFASTNSLSNNSLSFAQDGLYNRPRWTYADQSTYPATSVSKFLAYKDEIPSIYALTLSAGSFQGGTYDPKTAAGSFSIPTTLDHISDGSTRKLSNYLPLAGGTMTGNITLDGVSILPSGDAVDGGSGLGYLGSSSKRFRQGHIRDIYTSYFVFKDGNTGATRGSINYAAGAGFLSVVDGNDSSKTFAYKFYVNSSSNGLFYEEGSGANVPLGKSDHRWSKIWGIDSDLSGNIKLSGTTKRIYFGDTYYIELVDLGSGQNPRYALHTNAPIYSDSWIGDGGVPQTS